MMNKTALTVATLVGTLLVTMPGDAREAQKGLIPFVPPVIPGEWYYELGGHSPWVPPRSGQTLRIKPSLQWTINASCGNFDASTSVKNSLEGLREGFNTITKDLETQITGLIASLPLIVWARYDPQSYDMIMQGLAQGLGEYDVAIASCEAATQAAINNQPGFELIQISGLEEWTNSSSQPGSKDAVAERNRIASQAGREGVMWICGRKQGGKAQERIKLTLDMTKAGYNLLLGRDPCDMSKPSNSPTESVPEVVRYFEKPKDAQDFIEDALGRVEIQTCSAADGCERYSASPGKGIMPRAQEKAEEIHEKLTDIVNGSRLPSVAELEEVSFDNALITRGVITALREDPDAEMLMARLAQEVALSNTIKEALMARRFLVAAKKAPNADVDVTQRRTDELIQELSEQIEYAKQEFELNKMMAGSTAPMILQRQRARQQGMREMFFNQGPVAPSNVRVIDGTAVSEGER